MRIALALLLAALALPAIAQNYPKLKPGLWEMDRSGGGPSHGPTTRTSTSPTKNRWADSVPTKSAVTPRVEVPLVWMT